MNFLALMPILNGALNVLGTFTGSPAQAKASAMVQDAMSVVNAVTPLFQTIANGTEVTEAQVRAALAGKDSALAVLDAEIARPQFLRPARIHLKVRGTQDDNRKAISFGVLLQPCKHLETVESRHL